MAKKKNEKDVLIVRDEKTGENSVVAGLQADGSKVTDHHALLVTGEKPLFLSKEDNTVYQMIAGRMVEAFSDKCVKELTTVTALSGEAEFAAKGCVIRQAGWRAVRGEESEEQVLPHWKIGDTLAVCGVSLTEGKTKPKPLHTEASLLSAMETAGKDVEDEEVRQAMRECGIGTPAIRAAIIETLFARGYVQRCKKSLVPTEKGLPLYSAYMSHLYETDVRIAYAPGMDEFSAVCDRKNIKIWDEFCVKGYYRHYDGMSLLKHALHNTCPDMMKCIGEDENGNDIKVRDAEGIQLANAKIDEIRNGFSEWLEEQSPEFKERLVTMYNRKFNCFVRPKYDGSHQTFPDLDLKGLASRGVKDIYPSQKDCVWMLKQNGGGICDHEVGTGKTLIMCMAAHEMKRLGLAHKPMIIGLKANVAEIAATYQAAYPNARILYASEKDFSTANRVRFFNNIKNNDYDCVIMSHDQFGKIPQSPELQQRILQAELDSVEESLEVLRAQGKDISRAMLKGLEKRKFNLEAKLQKVEHAISSRTDDVVDFRQMGIDHLFVDESHQFKNLTFNTRHDRVAGLGNSEESQKALNMLFAIRTIQERTGKDLGATFLSGTTISNSLTELYLLFKYLRPKELERQDIRCFDAWAAIFAKKTTDFEFNVTNNVVQKERFRYFIKVPERFRLLQRDYRLPHGGGCGCGSSAQERGASPHTAHTRTGGLHTESDAVRQDGRCHAAGQGGTL